MHTGESSEVMIRGYCYSSTGPLPSLPASKYGLVQNAGRGGIAGRDRTQVQNAGVRSGGASYGAKGLKPPQIFV